MSDERIRTVGWGEALDRLRAYRPQWPGPQRDRFDEAIRALRCVIHSTHVWDDDCPLCHEELGDV